MSSQKGNVSRSRGQKHQNSAAYRNDKYGMTVQVKVRQTDSIAVALFSNRTHNRM